MKYNSSTDFTEPVSTLRVMEVDSQTDPRWEAFVTTLPNGLIYHHPAWLRVLGKEHGHRAERLPAGGAGVFDVQIHKAGLYPFVSHAFASVDEGQVGLLNVGHVAGTMSH